MFFQPFHLWSLFLISVDLKSEFYTSKSSPGTPSHSCKPKFENLLKNIQKQNEIISSTLKKNIILEHFNNSLEHYGIEIGLKSFRKHLGWYSKSLENSNEFRFKVNNSKERLEVENLIKDFF